MKIPCVICQLSLLISRSVHDRSRATTSSWLLYIHHRAAQILFQPLDTQISTFKTGLGASTGGREDGDQRVGNPHNYGHLHLTPLRHGSPTRPLRKSSTTPHTFSGISHLFFCYVHTRKIEVESLFECRCGVLL